MNELANAVLKLILSHSGQPHLRARCHDLCEILNDIEGWDVTTDQVRSALVDLQQAGKVNQVTTRGRKLWRAQ